MLHKASMKAVSENGTQLDPCVSVRLIQKGQKGEFLNGEGRVLQTLHTHPHPNIARIRTSIDCCGPAAELFDGAVVFPAFSQDLHAFVRLSLRGLKETTARMLFSQLAAAVAHCHSLRIAVGDIKLGKMLLTDADAPSEISRAMAKINSVAGQLDAKSSLRVVLADFSCSQLFNISHRPVIISKGSPAYVAPEVLQHQACDALAVDVWAVGVCLYVMLTCAYPFFAKDPQTLFSKITKGEVFYPTWISRSARSLISRMLCVDPAQRITMLEVLGDPWLRQTVEHSTNSSPACSPLAHSLQPIHPGSSCTHTVQRASCPFSPSSQSPSSHTSPEAMQPAQADSHERNTVLSPAPSVFMPSTIHVPSSNSFSTVTTVSSLAFSSSATTLSLPTSSATPATAYPNGSKTGFTGGRRGRKRKMAVSDMDEDDQQVPLCTAPQWEVHSRSKVQGVGDEVCESVWG